ncbi:Pr6Pr family membrane protein [Nocardia sp. NPDC005825]|uniref:Pr6Pr family membrane protein n=1 Tax=unclassified Nocardia TaxID=2637762 RepID=UPI0033FFEB29
MIARARLWHLLTFLVTAFALILQLVLVVQGGQHLNSETTTEIAAAPGLGARLGNFFSYLTIWSNALICGIAATLAVNPAADGRIWRALRLSGLIVIVGGGLVHFFFLRPLLDLHGADLLADKLLHMVVPLLAAIGWLLFGPRGRIDARDLVGFTVIPVVWLIYTFIRGAIIHWYPYPFLDADALGYPRSILNCVAVAALMIVMAFGARWLDPRLPGVAADS